MQASKLLSRAMSLAATGFLVGSCATSTKGGAELATGANPFEGPAFDMTAWAKQQNLPRFTVAFSGNVNGEIEPCGCAVNPKGGLDRRLNFIRREKAKHAGGMLVVDAGNALFANARIDDALAPAARERAELIMRGHALMGIPAQNVGYLDLAMGVDFAKKTAQRHGVKLLSLNWVDAQNRLLFDESFETQVNGAKITLVGLSRGFESEVAGGPRVTDPETALNKKLSQIAADRAVVVLSDLGNNDDRELAAKLTRPVIFIGARDLSSLEIPIHERNSIVMQGQLQGQQWGVAEFAWNARAQGWFNVALRDSFKDRWTHLQSDRESAAREPASDERTEEFRKIDASTAELLRYSPLNLASKGAYDYHLTDMTIEFAEANELTPEVAKLANPDRRAPKIRR